MPKKSLCGVEIEPSMLEPRNLSAKQPPSLDSGASCDPENQELVGILFSQALGNQCGVVCERSSTGKPVRGIENNLAKEEVALPQHANFRQSIPWESLQEPSTEVVIKRFFVLIWGFVFVSNDESSSLFWVEMIMRIWLFTGTQSVVWDRWRTN